MQATEFWDDIHGHVEEDILADLTDGESLNLGLESLPTLVGLCTEPPPPEHVGTAGYDRWVTRNWAGNISWTHGGQPGAWCEPLDVEELCEAVRSAETVRPLGCGHCFHAICDSDVGGVGIGLGTHMDQVIGLDPEARSVTVEGGCTYAQLLRKMHSTTDDRAPSLVSGASSVRQ
eukprot:COSAG04_NODE_2678_length_3745_cov_7.789358_2_plen_175_part_00